MAIALPPIRSPETGGDTPYRLSVDQYHAMILAGILEESNRTYLHEGQLINKRRKQPLSIVGAGLAQDELFRALPDGWFTSNQNPITIAESDSEPEPDLKVVRGEPRDYNDRHVTPADVALVVEVADSSVREDQTTMKALYALAAIPFYWLVNIPPIASKSTPSRPGSTPAPTIGGDPSTGPTTRSPSSSTAGKSRASPSGICYPESDAHRPRRRSRPCSRSPIPGPPPGSATPRVDARLLRVGGAGLLGLGLADFLRLQGPRGRQILGRNSRVQAGRAGVWQGKERDPAVPPGRDRATSTSGTPSPTLPRTSAACSSRSRPGHPAYSLASTCRSSPRSPTSSR